MHCLGWHFTLSLLYLVVKDQQYFVTSSFMFLEEKYLLEILLNPGLNLTIFRETGPKFLLTGLLYCPFVVPQRYLAMLLTLNKVVSPLMKAKIAFTSWNHMRGRGTSQTSLNYVRPYTEASWEAVRTRRKVNDRKFLSIYKIQEPVVWWSWSN